LAVRAQEVRMGQVGAEEVGPTQVGIAQTCRGEVRPDQ
jgi:hypothetical protein